MRTAPLITPPPGTDLTPISAAQPQSMPMDREFILRNQIAERVLGMPGEIRMDKDVPFESLR